MAFLSVLTFLGTWPFRVMTSYGVIEDLMYLGLEEREELVRDLGLEEG